MTRLINNGVTISVTPNEIDWYLNAGYVRVEPAEKETQSDEKVSLSDMTIAELRSEAKARGLSGYSNMSKDDLYDLLTKGKEGK